MLARGIFAARNSSSITSSSSAFASRPHGRGQPGVRYPSTCESLALLARREVSHFVEQRPDLGAVRFRLGAEVDREPAARPALHLACGAHSPLVGRTRELMQRDRAPQIQMRVVLPGEADPAERLHAVLAVEERGVERERSRRGDREAVAVAGIARGARGVPHCGAGELGARQHVGAPVLHALELADRPPELHPHLRVVGGGLHTPLRDTDRFRGEQHRREVAHTLGCDAGQQLIVATGDAFEVELSHVAREVDARQLLRARRDRVEGVPVAAELAYDHVGVVAAHHGAGTARARPRRCSFRP